jgi:phosphoribosylamine-glycine ligase
MLQNSPQLLLKVARNEAIGLKWKRDLTYGCSITLAGYGYPFTQVTGPHLPIKIKGKFDCDVWWNETTKSEGELFATGHRIADIVSTHRTLKGAIQRSYENVRRISCLSSYHRLDIGQSLWPPGTS